MRLYTCGRPHFHSSFKSSIPYSVTQCKYLVERVGVGSPPVDWLALHIIGEIKSGGIPSEEERKTNGLEYTGNNADGNGVKRALLGGDLGNELVLC